MYVSVSSQIIILCALVTCGCIIFITVYLCSLLKSAKVLTENVNTIASNIQKEIEPTLAELRQTASSINEFAQNANTRFQLSKASIATILGTGVSLGGKIKSFSQGIFKGISLGLKLFKK